MIKFWMVLRYLKDGKKYLNLSFVLSVVGVALGVASLVIAMAVVSGYETTLRDSVVNIQGHVVVVRRGGLSEGREQIEAQMRKASKPLKGLTPFAVVEGLIVHNKKLAGVVLEGFESQTVGDVLSLEKVLTEGQVFWKSNSESSAGVPAALIGKGIANRFGLKTGDEFKLVVPVSSGAVVDGFKPKMQRFKVSGVLDLGRTDYDERYIVTDIATTQKFGEMGEKITGWRMKLDHHDLADEVVAQLKAELGDFFWIRSWKAANQNLFQAVKYERVVIFVIVLLMVIAAAFNVASTLYLSVVKRYAQISLLKAIGVDSRFIRQLFTSQGIVVGVLGAALGMIWGWLGCRVFLWAEKKWGLFPGEVYKLDHVNLEMRTFDILAILGATLLICYLATLAPARRGAKLRPVEGLRYE